MVGGLTIWVYLSIGLEYCVIIASRPALGHGQLPLYFVARTLFPGTKWTELESDQFSLPRRIKDYEQLIYIKNQRDATWQYVY